MRKLKLEELGRLNVADFKSKSKFPISIVLDNLRSALNVGSFFRTSDSFAIEKIYLTGITAQPPHPEINKTAIGATLSVEWEYAKDVCELVKRLKESHQIIGVEQTNESIPLKEYKYDGGKPLLVVFGNEVDGITSDMLDSLDACIEIPQFGTKHSLNVAVCGGIVMHDLVMGLS